MLRVRGATSVCARMRCVRAPPPRSPSRRAPPCAPCLPWLSDVGARGGLLGRRMMRVKVVPAQARDARVAREARGCAESMPWVSTPFARHAGSVDALTLVHEPAARHRKKVGMQLRCAHAASVPTLSACMHAMHRNEIAHAHRQLCRSCIVHRSGAGRNCMQQVHRLLA